MLERAVRYNCHPFTTLHLLRLYREGVPEQERLRVLAGIPSRFMYAKVPETLRRDILLALEECRGEFLGEVEDGILYDLKFL